MKIQDTQKAANLIFGALHYLFGLERHELKFGGRPRPLADGRKVFVILMHEFTGATHAEISKKINLDRTTVSNHVAKRHEFIFLEPQLQQVREFVQAQTSQKTRVDRLEEKVFELESLLRSVVTVGGNLRKIKRVP